MGREEVKQKIRDRIRCSSEKHNVSQEECVLPKSGATRLVAVYYRIGKPKAESGLSYDMNRYYFEKYVNEHREWKLVGIYCDEGFETTSLIHMLEECEKGKIDLIISNTITRFTDDIEKSIQLIRQLAQLEKPVGVLFEKDNLYSLNKDTEKVLTQLYCANAKKAHRNLGIMSSRKD